VNKTLREDTASTMSQRAAQYVRMSTEHQQYSTANQEDTIREYAARRGFEIVRTYADEGKSGLSVAGRASLQKLIADVQESRADFSAILVYDVSRWGRFQDADESAYYEYRQFQIANATPRRAACSSRTSLGVR
jgi:DNA invertase Pin-like site-specific DNA recombinase